MESPLLLIPPCLLIGTPSWRAVINVNQLCELVGYILLKSKLIPDSLDNKSDLNKYDLSNIPPSWLFVFSHPYSRYSLKQARPWSQEYASLSASHTILKEWLWRICEKDELMKKVFTWFPNIRIWLTKILSALFSTSDHSGFGHEYKNILSQSNFHD